MPRKGTGLTIHERVNGAWRAQIRKQGFPYESKDFLSYEAAHDWGLHRLAEIQQTGRLVNRKPAEKTTFGQAIETYRDEVSAKRRSENSRVAETARLNRFLRAERDLCAHALAHLSPEMFEDWRDRRLAEKVGRGSPRKAKPVPAGRTRKDGAPRKNAAKALPPPAVRTIAPGTVKREMTLLKRVLDYAMKKYRLASNPLGDSNLVERPAVFDERDVRLNDRQWSILLESCRQSRNHWLAPFVEVALEIGARRGSLSRLEWKDVRLGECTVLLRDVKNSRRPNEIRTVEVGLSPRAVEIMAGLPHDLGGKVFGTTPGAINNAWKKARARAVEMAEAEEDKAQLAAFHLHDVRHEMASTLIEAGWNLADVMAQGDWRDPKSLKRYFTPRGKHLASKLAAARPGRGAP